MQIYPVTNAHHGDLYLLHNYLSCHPGWVKLYFGWVKSFTTILKLCVWLVQVISKWACRNVPWKVQVEHWVFRNKAFAIVALWWLKNSWNWCALFFNISVWFGTFEEKIISEWNLVLKKSLRIQRFFIFFFPAASKLECGEVVSNWITQTQDIFFLADAAWKHPKHPCFWILPLEFEVNIEIHKHENSEVVYSNRNKSSKEMSGNSRLQKHWKHVNRFHLTKCTGQISHTNNFISL